MPNAVNIMTGEVTLDPGYVAPSFPPPEQPLEAWRDVQVVSAFQAKAALLHFGMLDAAKAAVAASPLLVQLAFAEATEFRRRSPMMLSLAPALSLTDTQLDDLFRYAATVAV